MLLDELDELVAHLTVLRRRRAKHAADECEKKSGKRPAVYSGTENIWEKMLDRDDIDAVYIATPWNWHVLMALGLSHGIRRFHGKDRNHSHPSEEVERGPHDGFLVNLGHGFVEITIFETNAPPRFRLFFHNQRKQARSVPAHAIVKIETVRPSGARQTFAFSAKSEYLESTDDIPKPHEFKAIVQVSHGGHTHPPHTVQF